MKKPLINATLAAGYIVLVVLVIDRFTNTPIQEPNTLIPMVMLSLFVLSAAIMSYLFVYEPIRLLIESNKSGALKMFFQTISIFAVYAFLPIIPISF
jgi:hypothetical protein